MVPRSLGMLPSQFPLQPLLLVVFSNRGQRKYKKHSVVELSGKLLLKTPIWTHGSNHYHEGPRKAAEHSSTIPGLVQILSDYSRSLSFTNLMSELLISDNAEVN